MKEDLVDLARLARELKSSRKAHGLSIRGLANQIEGISSSTLSRIENAKMPDLESFFRVCTWLKASPESFMMRPSPQGASDKASPDLFGVKQSLLQLMEAIQEAGLLNGDVEPPGGEWGPMGDFVFPETTQTHKGQQIPLLNIALGPYPDSYKIEGKLYSGAFFRMMNKQAFPDDVLYRLECHREEVVFWDLNRKAVEGWILDQKERIEEGNEE